MVAACCNTDAEGLDNYATRSVAVVVANRVVDQAANSSIRGGQTSSNVPHIGQADQTDHLMMEIFRGRWIPVQCYVRYLDHEAVNTARADMLARWALCDTALAQHLMTASMDLDDVDRLWPVRCVKCSPLLKHSAVRYLRVMFGYHICTCRALPAGHAVSVRLLYALLSSAFVFMFFFLFLALFALFSLFVHLMHWLRFNGRTDRPIVLRCNKRMDRPIVLHCNGRTDPPIVLRYNGRMDRPIVLRCNGRMYRPIVLRCNGRMDRSIVSLMANLLITPHGVGCSLPTGTEWSGRFPTAIAIRKSPFSYRRMITGELRTWHQPTPRNMPCCAALDLSLIHI